MSAQAWQEAFLGVSAVLGEPLDASLGALPRDQVAGLPKHVLQALRAPSRQMRAQGIARALTAVVAGLEEMQLG